MAKDDNLVKNTLRDGGERGSPVQTLQIRGGGGYVSRASERSMYGRTHNAAFMDKWAYAIARRQDSHQGVRNRARR